MNALIKSLRILFFSFCVPIGLFSQNIKTSTVDAQTGNPIPYVNIGVPMQSLGTLSNDQGIFELSPTQAQLEESLHFSSIGYADTVIQIASLLKHPNSPIKLKPVTYNIPEVTVSPFDGKIKTLGIKPYKRFPHSKPPYVVPHNENFYPKDIGKEMVLFIPNHKKMELVSMYFQPFTSTAQKTLFRIVVYETVNFPDTVDRSKEFKKLKPGGGAIAIQYSSQDTSRQIMQMEKISMQDIIVAFDKELIDSLSLRPYEVDLRKYGIRTDKNLIIGLQLLHCSEGEISFYGKVGYPGLIRSHARQRWLYSECSAIMGVRAIVGDEE